MRLPTASLVTPAVITALKPATSAFITWTWARLDTLSADDVYDLLALRSAAFVVEQQCAFLDADGLDRGAWHLLGRVDADEGGKSSRPRALAAYLRCLAPGVKYPEPSIGRVIVAASHRGTGLGRILMREGIARAQSEWPGADILICAQLRLAAFYASLEFRSEGSPYVEDGIDHVEMRLTAVHVSHGEERR